MWRHCDFSGLLCFQACAPKGCSPPSSGHLPHLGTGRPICPSRHQPNPCHPGKFIRQEPPIKVHNHHALYVTPIMHSKLVYLIMSIVQCLFSYYILQWFLKFLAFTLEIGHCRKSLMTLPANLRTILTSDSYWGLKRTLPTTFLELRTSLWSHPCLSHVVSLRYLSLFHSPLDHPVN